MQHLGEVPPENMPSLDNGKASIAQKVYHSLSPLLNLQEHFSTSINVTSHGNARVQTITAHLDFDRLSIGNSRKTERESRYDTCVNGNSRKTKRHNTL